MRNFIVGVIVTLLVLGLGGLAIAMLGLLPRTLIPARPESSAASPCPPWMPPWSAMLLA